MIKDVMSRVDGKLDHQRATLKKKQNKKRYIAVGFSNS